MQESGQVLSVNKGNIKSGKHVMSYLFQAEFSDGSILRQSQADKSALLPPDENGNGKSAFYDVRMRAEAGELVRFHLIPLPEMRAAGGKKITVDFTDGHFEIDGFPVKLHDKDFLFVNPLRPIYWRDWDAQQTSLVATGEVTDEKRTLYQFRVGWQTNDRKGHNYQCVLTIGALH